MYILRVQQKHSLNSVHSFKVRTPFQALAFRIRLRIRGSGSPFQARGALKQHDDRGPEDEPIASDRGAAKSPNPEPRKGPRRVSRRVARGLASRRTRALHAECEPLSAGPGPDCPFPQLPPRTTPVRDPSVGSADLRVLHMSASVHLSPKSSRSSSPGCSFVLWLRMILEWAQLSPVLPCREFVRMHV